ncbi:MAG TPA: 4Fe-4S dicluster-binding protein, partial [Thermomicrobiaceae bacterium]|nr:4Fe-4S dicluster-binding protein [Thermomicrobiaceae bacterium]
TVEGDASLAGLWVFKDDLTHERVLGAIAGIDPSLLSIDAVTAYIEGKTHDEARVSAAREAYEMVQRTSRVVKPGEGIEWPYEIPTLPAWDEFRVGAAVPAVPRHFEIGPRGQSRNEQFKRSTTKSQRPVVRFDLCTKCTLCWVECPDECFDPTADGYYDVNYEYCVGCGKCAQVCPVKECIVMVDELQFTDYASPYEQWMSSPTAYVDWAEEKKGTERVTYPFVTGTGRVVAEGQHLAEGSKPVPKRRPATRVAY